MKPGLETQSNHHDECKLVDNKLWRHLIIIILLDFVSSWLFQTKSTSFVSLVICLLSYYLLWDILRIVIVFLFSLFPTIVFSSAAHCISNQVQVTSKQCMSALRQQQTDTEKIIWDKTLSYFINICKCVKRLYWEKSEDFRQRNVIWYFSCLMFHEFLA